MKVLVTIKRTLDYRIKARLNQEKTAIDLKNKKMAINPLDEIALESAIRLKEQGIITEIIAISIGDLTSQEQLRQALALGADNAILVNTENNLNSLDSLSIANILVKIIKNINPDLIFLGKQAIDSDNNCVGYMLSGKLNYPIETATKNIYISKQENCVIVTKEEDNFQISSKLTLPAIVNTDLSLNTPRIAKLPDIIKAKTKPLKIINLRELGVNTYSSIEVLNYSLPNTAREKVILKSVSELITNLRHAEQVI